MVGKGLQKLYLVCSCGCGARSAELGKEYIRVSGRRKWYRLECVPEDVEVLKDFKEGKIVREEDF